MKKKNKTTRGSDKTRSQYDFRNGVRGKHAREYAKGTNRVTLEPDVAVMFPDDESVNNALRVLADVARRHAASKPRTRKKAG